MITLNDSQVVSVTNMVFDAVETIVGHLVIRGCFGATEVDWVLDDLAASVNRNVQSDLAKRALYDRIELMSVALQNKELHHFGSSFVKE